MPERFSDAPNAGRDPDRLQLLAESTSRVVTAAAGRVGLPALVRFGIEGGWDPLGHVPAPREPSAIGSTGDAPALVEMTADLLDRVSVADRVGPIASGAVLSSLLRNLGAGGTTGVGAVVGDQLVGVTVVAALRDDQPVELFTIGVAPDWRRRGLGAALLDRLMVEPAVAGRPLRVELGPAERDVVDPSPLAERQLVARRLLGRAGFEEVSGERARDSLDLPSVLHFRRPATA